MMLRKAPFWNNGDLRRLESCRSHIPELAREDVKRRLLTREYDRMAFYDITPKENLPKYLQKLDFQSIHVKEKQTQKNVRIFRREKKEPDEICVRQTLKESGSLLYLSQIFTMLGSEGEYSSVNNPAREQEEIRDLEEWEKSHLQGSRFGTAISPKSHIAPTQHPLDSAKPDQQKTQQLTLVLEEMRNSQNYCHEVTQSLETLSKLHADERNPVAKMSLIESNAILIKNELDSKRHELKRELEAETKLLEEKRKDYHNLFVYRTRLQQEEKSYEQQLKQHLDEMKGHSMSLLSLKTTDKRLEDFRNRRLKLEEEQETLRGELEDLESKFSKLSDEEKSLQFAQLLYYRLSLKIGIDCRENGLSWLIMELKRHGDKVTEESLPNYLDKRSKDYLLNKTHHEEVLDQLVKEKFEFVKLIMRETLTKKRISQIKQGFASKNVRKNSMTLQQKERPESQEQGDYMPYKNARSTKLLSKINEIKKEGIMVAAYASKSNNPLEEFTFQYEKEPNPKKLYEKAITKLRNVYTKELQHSRVENQKTQLRSRNLLSYNSLLQKIKEQHIYLDDLDIQQESHLLNHYSKEAFVEQAAACFGTRKALALLPRGTNSH